MGLDFHGTEEREYWNQYQPTLIPVRPIAVPSGGSTILHTRTFAFEFWTCWRQILIRRRASEDEVALQSAEVAIRELAKQFACSVQSPND